MAYLRGEIYVWRDDTGVHIWTAEGAENWRDSGWAEEHGGTAAAGLFLPPAIFDSLVVMRVAELVESGNLADVVSRSLADNGGMSGAEQLARHADRLKTL